MPRSIFMPEMTNLEVQEYLDRGGRTVIVPVGSTEDHGDHGPLWTDVYIPTEVAKRAAPELDALVGPPVPFGIAHDHRGAAGVVHVRLDTFVNVLRDVCRSLADVGFTRVVLLNGHYCNSHAMEFAVAQFFDELPEGVRVYPFPYWAGMKPEEAEQYLSGSVGIHANVGETSAVLAINPNLCDMGKVPGLLPGASGAPHGLSRDSRPAVPLDARLLLVAARGRGRRLGQAERVDCGEGRGVPDVERHRRRQPREGHGRRARPARAPLQPIPPIATRCRSLTSRATASTSRSTARATPSSSLPGSAPTRRRGRFRPST